MNGILGHIFPYLYSFFKYLAIIFNENVRARKVGGIIKLGAYRLRGILAGFLGVRMSTLSGG